MKILIATRFHKEEGERHQGDLALGYLLGKGHDAQLDDFLDWRNREDESQEEKYRRMLEPFDGVIAIEDENREVARGQYSLLEIALGMRKHAWVWRGGRGVPVKYLLRAGDLWKKGYGKVAV